jgi:glycosyltransferase involved in cell wall biosynthesis
LAETVTRLNAPTIAIPCGPYAYGRKSVADHARFAFDLRRASAILRRAVAERHFDLVYVNGPRVLAASSRCGVPLLFHAHSRLVRSLDLWIARKSLQGASVIAASRFVAEPLSAFSAPRVIPNGTPDLGFTEKRFDAQLLIGVVGRIAPEKGQAEFVEAVRILHRDHLNCTFAIRGEPMFADPGYAAGVSRRSAGLPIEFSGWRRTPREALDEVDVLVVPSAPNDAVPRVILEAFSAGIPVVAFASGGIPGLIADEETGFLASTRSPEALAARLKQVLASPALLMEVVRRARQTWEREYTLGRFRSQVLAEFEYTILRSKAQNKTAATTASRPADPTTGG